MIIRIETGDKVPKDGIYQCTVTGEEMEMDKGETCRGYLIKNYNPNTNTETSDGIPHHGHFIWIRDFDG